MYLGSSCHDESYNVCYSYADNPMDPFTPGATVNSFNRNNPNEYTIKIGGFESGIYFKNYFLKISNL